MAYFDSAKNRALWQEELARLTAEKERRKKGGASGGHGKDGKVSSAAENPQVVKITFQELVEEQRALEKEKKAAHSKALEAEKNRTQDPVSRRIRNST